MHKHQFIGLLVVTATLLAPGLSLAAGAPPAVSVRVFDRTHKDYHVWDDNEDKTFRVYLGDQHMKYRRYSRLNRGQQTNYWNWRHTHGGDR